MTRREVFNPELGPECYSLDKTTIEAITEVKPMSGKMADFDWPLELQGKGLTHEKEKGLEIRYPKGDIFLSYVTTIHELGHLRQEELNPALKSESQNHEALYLQEQDAWARGWKRFSEANPDLIGRLEAKFAEHKKGEMGANSFADLYVWVKENALQMVEVQRVLFEKSEKTDLEKMDKLADELKALKIDHFLKKYTTARIGEMVDENEMRRAIGNTVERIIQE